MSLCFKISLSLFIVFFSFSQSKAQSVVDSIIGSWDIFHSEKSDTVSNKILEEMKTSTTSFSNNNKAIYRFTKNGSFNLSSIQDFGQSNEKGRYKIDQKKRHISRKVTYSNPLNKKKGSKKKISSFICYINDKYLVLREKNMYIYLHRYNN